MRKTIATFVITALFGSASFANIKSGRYEIVSKNDDDCPLVLQVEVQLNQVRVLTTNTITNTPGPFHNTLYFSDFDNQWKVTSRYGGLIFSSKSQYHTDASKSFVSDEEKLEEGRKLLRHTRVTLSTTSAATYLSYNILALDSKTTAPAYTNILCQYKEAR
ncbi:MAG: hypothetical protein HUU57_13585 [Bdellovibrio sp.]|nr:hypothetical protein [Bdellovibrio sp.]